MRCGKRLWNTVEAESHSGLLQEDVTVGTRHATTAALWSEVDHGQVPRNAESRVEGSERLLLPRLVNVRVASRRKSRPGARAHHRRLEL